MKTIKAKEYIDKYGIKYLIYKDGRKKVGEISFPTERTNGVRFWTRCTAAGLRSTLEDCKEDAERFIYSYFSIFGGCEIVYQ